MEGAGNIDHEQIDGRDEKVSGVSTLSLHSSDDVPSLECGDPIVPVENMDTAGDEVSNNLNLPSDFNVLVAEHDW
jgi:hypothetical protein